MRKLIKRYQLGGVQTSGLGKTTFANYSYNTNLPGVNGREALKAKVTNLDTSNYNKVNSTMNFATGIGMQLTSLLGNETSSETNKYNQGYMAVSDALSGTPAGWILKLGAMGSEIGYALGDKTDQVTPEDQFLDSYFARITPGGWYNIATTKKSDKLLNGADEMLTDLGSAYGDVQTDYDEVKGLAGKRIGNAWGQLDRANRRINNVNSNLIKMQSIWNKTSQNKLLTAQMEDRWNQSTMNELNGGFGNIYRGRRGFKFEILEKVHEILNRPKVIDTIEPQQFKEGGKMNVIPEGALHARLHHMENAEGLTKKGIPVVSIKEGGELEQQAEIELNEIIFNLDVTTELEKLMKDGSDNAAIEAGKLLVKEIFENTDDRTGLIDKLTTKESTPEEAVKNHQVFQDGGTVKPKFEDWIQTVPKERRNPKNYNLKRAFELAPWEQLERWRKATPGQLTDDAYHLNTFYWNNEGVGEFVKKNGHPTLFKELEFYFGNSPQSKDFREKFDLDMSGEYFKYVKK